MWYIYFYKDPKDDSIFYVGKGKNNRSKAHLYRASTWVKKGKPSKYGSCNLHLIRKIVKIREEGYEPIIEIIEYYDNENDAYEREIHEISIRKDNICNITNGGEGFKPSNPEVIKQITRKRNEWLQTEAGLAWRKRISEARKGKGNPNFGKKESEEHKQSRMKNCLAKERWNKGLKGDPRSKGYPKGNIPVNAKKSFATSVNTGQIIEAASKAHLFKKMNELGIQISISSIDRSIKENRPKKGWKFTYASS